MIILRNSQALLDFQRGSRPEKISSIVRPDLSTAMLSNSSGGLPARKIKSQILTVLTRFSASTLGSLFLLYYKSFLISVTAFWPHLSPAGPCNVALSFLWTFAAYVPFSCRAYPTMENSCSIFKTHSFLVRSPLRPNYVPLRSCSHCTSHIPFHILQWSCLTSLPLAEQ